LILSLASNSNAYTNAEDATTKELCPTVLLKLFTITLIIYSSTECSICTNSGLCLADDDTSLDGEVTTQQMIE